MALNMFPIPGEEERPFPSYNTSDVIPGAKEAAKSMLREQGINYSQPARALQNAGLGPTPSSETAKGPTAGASPTPGVPQQRKPPEMLYEAIHPKTYTETLSFINNMLTRILGNGDRKSVV